MSDKSSMVGDKWDYSPSGKLKSALFTIDAGKHTQYENRIFCVQCGYLVGTRVSPFGPVTGPVEGSEELIIRCPRCSRHR